MRGAILALALAGCEVPAGQGPGGGSEGPPPIRLESDSFSQSTNNSAKLKVEVDVPEDAVAFQVTGDSSKYVSYDSIVDPDGRKVLDRNDWLSSAESVTLSFFPQRHTTALNWPIRGIDDPLTPGLWTVTLTTTDAQYYYSSGANVDVTTELKFDPDLSTGKIGVQVVWADGVDAKNSVVTAVEAATDRWAEVWGKQGLEVNYYFVSSNLDPKLKFTYTGDDLVETVAKKKDPGDLQLIVGDLVGNDMGTFGVSAGIPGTIEPSPSTYVVLAWMSHAGTDGKFDDDEIRLMGETMAHECGHYTGLFHPVEATYNAWDAIDDTPRCTKGSTCDDQLGDNVMYPYPLCTASTCAPQGKLTDDQGDIMNQYVGAL